MQHFEDSVASRALRRQLLSYALHQVAVETLTEAVIRGTWRVGVWTEARA